MLALASSSDPTSSPYMFLTKVYPALTHACEDNWQRNWQRNYENPPPRERSA